MVENKAVYVTPEGLAKLKAELDELVNVRRVALAQRLGAAIKQGDLSENADYITAKEEQGFLEGRIRELELAVRNAVVIETPAMTDGRVALGSHVTVVEEGYDDQETYHIVGPLEADPTKGKISHESPLGEALMGRKVGDKVTVQAPAGEIAFHIAAIT
ncbi:MAG TPA: transcription elongation factor GreA [Anaerolineae bacterium]|nr:transcription elongation factor GreA [Anaerolineae bacterium]HQH37861.1 transcription elongation factor GreA [Anaerolineae bacterium]